MLGVVQESNRDEPNGSGVSLLDVIVRAGGTLRKGKLVD